MEGGTEEEGSGGLMTMLCTLAACKNKKLNLKSCGSMTMTDALTTKPQQDETSIWKMDTKSILVSPIS